MAPHEPLTQIRIQAYDIVTTPSRYVQYTINLQGPVRSWTVTKRYSELDSLHHKMNALAPTPVQLPGKTLFSSLPSQAFNADFLTARRTGLERYLQAILHHPNAIWRRSKEWCDFFGIPDRKAGARAVSGSWWLKSESANGKDDAESWMEEYASVMDTLRQVRQYVVERDKAYARGDSTIASTAAMNGKKVLASLTSRIKTLEDALVRINAANNTGNNTVNRPANPPGYDDSISTVNNNSSRSSLVGGGELNRRNDMIATLRDERDALTRVLALPPRNVDRGALFGASSSGDSINNPVDTHQPSSSSVTAKTARKFGSAVPQETEITRPLSNAGVLQHQQHVIATQDEDVDALLTIIRRQKEIGNAISDELDVQNQMLDELDQSVDRTKTGVRKVNRQLDKMGKG
ncbi:hypothetical protein SeMB42_g04287 [Synchytrium endobioticum]|nr:hypothetical protein SeMB42_g04287 [Synchytrium endobioticum]